MSATVSCAATSTNRYHSAGVVNKDGAEYNSASRLQACPTGLFQAMDGLEHYGAHDFQALGAEFVHGVLIGVPILIVGAVVEVDDVEDRDAEHLKRDVVVFFGRHSLIEEIGLVAEVGGGAPDELLD